MSCLLVVALCGVAISPGTALADGVTLTPPCSVPGTLTLTPAPYGTDLEPICFAGFKVALHAGESLVATLTTGPGVTGTDFRVTSNIGDYFFIADASPTSVTVLPFAGATTQTAWLTVYSSTPGTFTLDLGEAEPFKVSIGAMRAPKTAKRKRRFSVSASLADYNGFVTPIRFVLDRKVRGKWRPYSSAAAHDAFDIKSWTYESRLRLPRGTFRIRARFKDAAHPVAQYNRWKTIVVK
jgi:hypothetical protein